MPDKVKVGQLVLFSPVDVAHFFLNPGSLITVLVKKNGEVIKDPRDVQWIPSSDGIALFHLDGRYEFIRREDLAEIHLA